MLVQRQVVLLIAVVLVQLVCGWAHASEVDGYSPYEKETLDQALKLHKAQLDSAPEGKTVESISINVLDVIEERDPAPNFLNWLHSNSRDGVIRRELLFSRGDAYEQAMISESERNLRALRQVSLVIIVPLRGSSPDKVKVLVIAKDVWSLRLNSDYRFKAGALEYLLLQPAEENLAGTHRRISAQFIYKPDTLAFGGRFRDPRLDGSRLELVADANVIVNQDTGDAEGTFGFFQYGVPLYSTKQKWAWGALAQWSQEVTRRFIGTELAGYDADATPQIVDNIPFVYDTDIVAGTLRATRSFGTAFKHNLSLGMVANRRSFRAPDLSGFVPAAADEFRQQVVPLTTTRNGPYLQYHFYRNSYGSMLDVETLGLQETYRLGPDVYLRLYPYLEAFGSTRNLIGYHAEAAYTVAHRGLLARAYLAGTVEAASDHSEIYDSLVHGGLRVVSPNFFIGRLVYDGTLSYRPNNSLNTMTSLGGDGRLRGYPTAFFLGENMLASNLEFRSRTFSLWTVQVAGALFYDVGDVFDSFDEVEPKQGAGFGLRVQFPQLGRTVMRVDWGFALTPEASTGNAFEGLVLTFRQAFSVPRLSGTGVRLRDK